jgi:hypothetical protein
MNVLYRFVLALAIAGSVAFGTVALASAAANPSETGQPGAECGEEDAILEPFGFTDSAGFAHAETVYAGSDGTASALNANSPDAVSQYDVACFQYTANHS